MLLDYKGFTGLFTGDIEGAGEEMAWEYMRKQKKVSDLTLLKVAHHGSAYSTRREMLELFSPKLAFISCGANNRYGHPHEELLERLGEAGRDRKKPDLFHPGTRRSNGIPEKRRGSGEVFPAIKGRYK